MLSNLQRGTAGLVLALLGTSAVFADTQFQARRMTRGDVPLGKGQCDIRLRVDSEAEISVRGDMIHVRTISGRDARDDGSECNEPLPARNVSDFNFEVRDRRGDIVLLSEPAQRTGYRAVVRIRDNEGGEGRYHFRLTWQMDGGGSGRGGGSFPDDRRRGGIDDRPRGGGSHSLARAMEGCSEAVTDRIADEYPNAEADILSISADNGPGRNDYIIGEAAVGRGRRAETLAFACRVDLNTGRVRTVNVRRR
ncbi:MAG: hypothetical protein ACRD88_07245 [Terriglobia bacterium]